MTDENIAIIDKRTTKERVKMINSLVPLTMCSVCNSPLDAVYQQEGQNIALINEDEEGNCIVAGTCSNLACKVKDKVVYIQTATFITSKSVKLLDGYIVDEVQEH